MDFAGKIGADFDQSFSRNCRWKLHGNFCQMNRSNPVKYMSWASIRTLHSSMDNTGWFIM
jgi:hypothetical protein